MQTKGGGKHHILPVARAIATTLECLWMMPRDPDADMCCSVPVTLQSTEECMALQSYVRRSRFAGMSMLNISAIERSRTRSREVIRLHTIKQGRRLWWQNSREDAQLGGQDKASRRSPFAALMKCLSAHCFLHGVTALLRH